MLKPETLGLCVCLSMEKKQQRLSLEGCGAAGTSETKDDKSRAEVQIKCSFHSWANRPGHYYRHDPVFGMMIFKWCQLPFGNETEQ